MITLEEQYGPIKSPTYTILVDGIPMGNVYIYEGCKKKLLETLGKMQMAYLEKRQVIPDAE